MFDTSVAVKPYCRHCLRCTRTEDRRTLKGIAMKRLTSALLFSLCSLSLSQLASAALKPGEKAPDFSTQASLGGQVSTFSLAETLKKGPVVLYFYPAAFTTGCTIEAHLFAEAIDRYKALGATVIGVSNDKIETLNKFSVSNAAVSLRSPPIPIRRS